VTEKKYTSLVEEMFAPDAKLWWLNLN
jgi:hypothetical protein